MTATERSHKYRAAHRPLPAPGSDKARIADLEREVERLTRGRTDTGARLHSRIAELEAENATLKAGPARAMVDSISDPETFPKTWKDKFDRAVAQYQRKLDAQLNAKLEAKVLEEIKRRIDEIVLPHWKEKIAT
jgi:hypothetical protein